MSTPRDTPPRPSTGSLFRIGLVAATVLLLAFAAQQMLGIPLSGHRREPARYSIEAREAIPRTARAEPREFWVDRLFVDGRLLRADLLEAHEGWQPTAMPESSSPPGLLFSRTTGPAVLTFRAARFLLVARTLGWSGVLRVERDGTPLQTIEVGASADGERVLVVEDPAGQTSRVVFLLALVGFGALAWRISPVRDGRTGLAWLILFLAVMHLLFWATQPVGTTTDSHGYLLGVRSLFKEGVPAYFPPGYPALLGSLTLLPGQELGRWITLVQHALAVCAAIWTYLLLRRITSDGLAFLGGLVAGALTPVLTMPQTVMSETATLFAMVGTLYWTVRGRESGRLGPILVAGALLGWAVTVRVVPGIALLPAIALIHLLPPTRRGLRLTALTIGLAALVILMPLTWFWHQSRDPRLADSAGLHLYNRVVTEQKQLDERGPATLALLTLLDGSDPRGVPHWTVREQGALQRQDYYDTERLLGAVAREGIWKDPPAFLLYSVRLAWRELRADPTAWIPYWADNVLPETRLESPPLIPFTAAALRFRWQLEAGHGPAWLVFCCAGIAGVLFGLQHPRRSLVLGLAWVPAGYLLASASLDVYSTSHSVPIAPFVAALAMLPLAAVRSAVSRTLVMRRPAPESAG